MTMQTYDVSKISPVGEHTLVAAEFDPRQRAGRWECTCGSRGKSTEGYAGESIRGRLILGWRQHVKRATALSS